MTLETYLKNRSLFESRYNPNELGTCYLVDMNKGIRNFKLFFALYGHDRRVHLRSNTYGVDRRKRYTIPFKKDMNGRKLFREYAQYKGKEAVSFVEIQAEMYECDTLITKDVAGKEEKTSINYKDMVNWIIKTQ